MAKREVGDVWCDDNLEGAVEGTLRGPHVVHLPGGSWGLRELNDEGELAELDRCRHVSRKIPLHGSHIKLLGGLPLRPAAHLF